MIYTILADGIFHNETGDVQHTDYGEWTIEAANEQDAVGKLAAMFAAASERDQCVHPACEDAIERFKRYQKDTVSSSRSLREFYELTLTKSGRVQ